MLQGGSRNPPSKAARSCLVVFAVPPALVVCPAVWVSQYDWVAVPWPLLLVPIRPPICDPDAPPLTGPTEYDPTAEPAFQPMSPPPAVSAPYTGPAAYESLILVLTLAPPTRPPAQ